MTYIDTTPESLEGLSIDQLSALRTSVLAELDDIKRQIDLALADRAIEGQFRDPIWFAKARIARRARGRRVQQINERLMFMIREEKQSRVREAKVADMFLAVAKESLPEELFRNLLAAAWQQTWGEVE